MIGAFDESGIGVCGRFTTAAAPVDAVAGFAGTPDLAGAVAMSYFPLHVAVLSRLVHLPNQIRHPSRRRRYSGNNHEHTLWSCSDRYEDWGPSCLQSP